MSHFMSVWPWLIWARFTSLDSLTCSLPLWELKDLEITRRWVDSLLWNEEPGGCWDDSLEGSRRALSRRFGV